MGKVYLIDVGLGDSDLVTVEGMKAIQASDVILYNRLVNKEIPDSAKPHTEFFCCGKDPNKRSLPQGETNRMLMNLARKRHTIIRLKGGGPFIFGRGGEEAEILSDNQIPFEIISGITSEIVVLVYAGTLVTYRGYSSSIMFIAVVNKPGITKEAYWEHLARGPGTLCIYIGVRHLSETCELLVRHGKSVDTPVALVHLRTIVSQKTVTGTLDSIVQCASGVKNPAMIVTGDVVNMRQKISRFKEQVSDVEMTLP